MDDSLLVLPVSVTAVDEMGDLISSCRMAEQRVAA